MNLLFSRKLLWFILIIVSILVFSSAIAGNYTNNKIDKHTQITAVSLGNVSITVTVSGKIEPKNITNLSFPAIGVVQDVYKKEGDHVNKGEILATLTQNSALGDYNAAVQNLKFLESSKIEMIKGPVMSNRKVSETSVKIAEDNLVRVKEEQSKLVKNALEILVSSDIEAYPFDNSSDEVPPTISGSYLCKEEGVYVISIFGSKSPSSFSYKLSGLEEGTFTAFTGTPAPLGTCGLYIKFDENQHYKAKDWIVSIPNKRSSQYILNRNNYDLALQKETNAMSAAEQELELAKNTKEDTNSAPSSEALDKIDANIAKAKALLTVAEAKIADYTIRAPFEGTITEQNIKVGETATQNQSITILEEGSFELKARIPEVDITNIKVGDKVLVSFDARPLEIKSGEIKYISPNSTEIDGVAYYEATLDLQENPDWLRAGLNADVKIVMKQREKVLRLPESFIVTDSSNKYVIVKNESGLSQVVVKTGLTGNDGYTEVLNLPEGTEVILP